MKFSRFLKDRKYIIEVGKHVSPTRIHENCIERIKKKFFSKLQQMLPENHQLWTNKTSLL